jgi:hypothetical protein
MEQQKLSERLLEAERRHVDALAAAEARQQEMDAQAGQLTALQDRLAATDEAAAAAQTMRTALEVRCGNGVRWGNMQGPLNARSPEQRVPWLQSPPTQARVQEAVRASESAQQRLEAAEQELRAAHAQLQEATQRTEAAEAALMELFDKKVTSVWAELEFEVKGYKEELKVVKDDLLKGFQDLMKGFQGRAKDLEEAALKETQGFRGDVKGTSSRR